MRRFFNCCYGIGNRQYDWYTVFGFLYSAFNSYIPVIVLLLAMIGLCAGMIFIAYAFKKHMWKKEAQLEEKEQVLSEPMILNPEMAE